MSDRDFITREPDPHLREEQLQWARMLSQGDPVKGMALVYIQKMCTAFHEIEPGAHASALKEEALPFFQERMLVRIRFVLDLYRNNDLTSLPGYAELEAFTGEVRAASSVAELAALAEKVHQINHALCDALAGE